MTKHTSCHASPATPLRRPLAWALAAAIALTVLAGIHLSAQDQTVAPETAANQPAPADAGPTTAAAERPTAPAEQPAAPVEQPTAPVEQPTAAGDQPTAAGEQPTTAGNQPTAVTITVPAATGQPEAAGQPATTVETPPATGTAPSATTEQPAVTPGQPAVTTEQPATTAQPVPAVPAITPALMAQGEVLMNFTDANLSSVLNYLSEAAGLVIIPEVTIEGRVTITSRQPMKVDEAITQLNSALKGKGYAAIRMGRTLKIVTLDEAKKDLIPVRTGNDPALIELSDEVITQIIPIRYLDAVRLRDDLSPLIPAYAQLTANAASNSLIMTDTSASVHRIAEIIQALDTHMATVAEVKIFRLEFADASSAASLINTIFQQQQPAAGARGGIAAIATIFGQGGRGGRGGTADQGAGAQAPRVLAAADARTNTLVVTGPGDTLKIVELVVKDLDSNPAEEEDVMVYALKNAQAANLTTVLNSLFQTSTTTGARGATTGARGTTTGARGAAGARGTTTAAARAGTTNPALAGLSGQVYVVSDADTNSLLIRTPPKNFELVRAIIADLDRPVPQVLIKVLIAEVTHEDTTDMGAEFSVLNLLNGTGNFDLSTDFGVAAQTQGLIYKVIHGDTTAILRLLETVGKLEVLSRPYILTSDNQEATITVGDTVPFVRTPAPRTPARSSTPSPTRTSASS